MHLQPLECSRLLLWCCKATHQCFLLQLVGGFVAVFGAVNAAVWMTIL
jgi:hypothetical protein